MTTITSLDFRALGILYLALLLGPLFMLMAAMIVGNGGANMELFQTIGPIISVMTIALSFVVYNMRKTKGQELSDLDEKFLHFRTSIIIRSAMLEFGNIILVSFVFLDASDWIYLIFFAIGMGVLLLVKPTLRTFIEDYKLNDEETRIIQNLKAK